MDSHKPHHLHQVIPTKRIYRDPKHPQQLIKGISLDETPREQIDNEISLQTIGARLGLSPGILRTYEDKKANMFYIVMDSINGMTLGDFFGPDIPPRVWAEVRRIVSTLLQNGIQYVDITPHNFLIEADTERIYVIDYGHASRIHLDWFLEDFLNGHTRWNPDYA